MANTRHVFVFGTRHMSSTREDGNPSAVTLTTRIEGRDGMATVAEEEGRPSILLLRPILPYLEDTLSSKYRILRAWESALTPEKIEGARALVCSGLARVDSATLQSLPGLECVVSTSAGVDHIDLAECRRRGIAITNAGDAFSQDVADYALGLLLDTLRRVSASDRYVRSGQWSRKGDYPILGRKVSLSD